MDAASGHIEVEIQMIFSTQETIKAIRRHKQKARDNRIIVQECQFENGSSSASKTLKEHLTEEGQTSRFSGAGRHHPHDRAKQGVQTAMGSAQMMTLHCASHWSDAADTGLWPMSV